MGRSIAPGVGIKSASTLDASSTEKVASFGSARQNSVGRARADSFGSTHGTTVAAASAAATRSGGWDVDEDDEEEEEYEKEEEDFQVVRVGCSARGFATCSDAVFAGGGGREPVWAAQAAMGGRQGRSELLRS